MDSQSTTLRSISVRKRGERVAAQRAVRREARLRPRTGAMPMCSLVRGRPSEFDDDTPTRPSVRGIRWPAPSARRATLVTMRVAVMAMFLLTLALFGAVALRLAQTH